MKRILFVLLAVMIAAPLFAQAPSARVNFGVYSTPLFATPKTLAPGKACTTAILENAGTYGNFSYQVSVSGRGAGGAAGTVDTVIIYGKFQEGNIADPSAMKSTADSTIASDTLYSTQYGLVRNYSSRINPSNNHRLIFKNTDDTDTAKQLQVYPCFTPAQ